jgi:hypothetical protein
MNRTGASRAPEGLNFIHCFRNLTYLDRSAAGAAARTQPRSLTGYLYGIAPHASAILGTYGFVTTGTAEMITKATAMGPSSLMVRSIWGS